jgi:hypothetical protein
LFVGVAEVTCVEVSEESVAVSVGLDEEPAWGGVYDLYEGYFDPCTVLSVEVGEDEVGLGVEDGFSEAEAFDVEGGLGVAGGGKAAGVTAEAIGAGGCQWSHGGVFLLFIE